MRRRLRCPVLLGFCLALALAPAAGGQAPDPFRGNADQPIEIDADSLEVQQDDQVAVFRGNVDAVQGEIRLQADELRVYYRGGGAGNGRGAAIPAGSGGNIVRIDALGRVRVASPGETAAGDVGVYDVPARTITLDGNVVLTRGQNVLRGNRLVMNMETGLSRITGGRVKAIIDPKRQR